LRSISWHIVGILLAALFVSPLIWTLTMSLRPTGKPFPRSLEFIPDQLTAANYSQVFEIVAFARFALNSLFVAAIAVPVTVLVASMAGFAMSQLPRQWRMRLIAAAFVALMVPLTAVWLPRFIFIKEIGLIDSRWSLVLPAAFGTSPFYVLLFMWSFVRLPREMFDAGRVDGAEVFRLWVDLAIPLTRPTATAVAVLSFVRYWSSFIEPLLYIQSTSKMTLPMGLNALLQLDRANWPLLMAGAVLVTAPVVLVFLIAQRAFLRDHAGLDSGLR
jgi:multiple sugar transport system permease protein